MLHMAEAASLQAHGWSLVCLRVTRSTEQQTTGRISVKRIRHRSTDLTHFRGCRKHGEPICNRSANPRCQPIACTVCLSNQVQPVTNSPSYSTLIHLGIIIRRCGCLTLTLATYMHPYSDQSWFTYMQSCIPCYDTKHAGTQWLSD